MQLECASRQEGSTFHHNMNSMVNTFAIKDKEKCNTFLQTRKG